MRLGTAKNASLEGQRLLVVQPLTSDLSDTGKRLVCTDWTGAGAGETIYWVRGREASIPSFPGEPPTDATIVGIVDSVHREARPANRRGPGEGRDADRARVGSWCNPETSRATRAARFCWCSR